MKKILVLHSKDGSIETVRWGELPGEWNQSIFYKTDSFKEKDVARITSTFGVKTFYLQAKIIEGHLWWKKKYGHYTEKLESRNIGELLNVWENYKKTE